MVTEWQKNRAAALEAATPFLEQIYDKLEGNLAIVTKDERDELSSERWFTVDQIESVQQYCSARWDEDVYFSVSVFPTESRLSNTGSQTRVVYVDADTCDPANFRLPPSIEVQTSPGKWHCLWILDRPTSGILAAELSAKVSLAHSGEGADKHARDTKILRVPGTTNTKYAEPYKVTAAYRDVVYSFESFAATYSDIDLAPPLPAVFGSDFKADVYTSEQLASLQRYADAVWERALLELNNEAAKDWDGEGWDNVALRVAYTLMRVVNAPWAHRTFEDAVALMNSSELNDPSFQASDKLLRTERALNGESLRLPDWAEPYQRLTLPTPSEDAREALEERIDRAGFTQWYVSVPQNGETERFLLDLVSKAQSAGFSDEEVYAVATWSQVWGKAKGSTFTNEGLWLYLTNKDDDLEAVANAIPLPLAGKLKTPPLLSELERQWCRSNPSFPDDYTSWVASTGTDSATVYQRTCAYQILSGIYGDIGFLRDEFGDSRLSIYSMVLGDSCQPLSAKVLTPSGWTTMGEISSGDYVIGSAGHPIRVLAVKQDKTGSVYRITFQNGTVVESTLDHLWTVKGEAPGYRVMQLADIITGMQQGHRFYVPDLMQPAFLNDQPVPLNPYVLGVWLAEGLRDPRGYYAAISGEAELMDLVSKELPNELYVRPNPANDVSYIVRKDGHGKRGPQGFNTVREALKSMGLLGLYQKERYIPDIYKYNSIETRLALIQGIMDGDGAADQSSGSARFECISEKLTRDVAEVARSLGMRVGRVLPAGETVSGNPIWRVNLRMRDSSLNPFRLSRKASVVTVPAAYNTGIVSVEYVREDVVRCISVDSSDELYVTDDFVLTHNTLTRKTTAKDRMIAVIRGYEDRSGRIINLTSNATTEALLRALSQANNETRLMWTDEVQSFLDEVGTKKYLTGFLGTLAKVYDGTVDASLRVGQNNGNASAVVTFDFMGIGIREQVAKVLTTDNYASGLLPRFVWAVADPPPFTPDAFALTPKRVERTGGFDEYPEIGAMCNRFITTRRKLGEGQPEPVYLTVEAITRMNEMNVIVCDYLRDTKQEQYLSAAWGRLFASIRKAAALLALHDGVRDVTLHHALHAIHQGEFWLRDMVRMANEVAASDFDRQVDEMEKYILEAKNHQRTQADLRNKFRGLKYQDYKELLMNLVQRGRVKYDNHTETITAFMI